MASLKEDEMNKTKQRKSERCSKKTSVPVDRSETPKPTQDSTVQKTVQSASTTQSDTLVDIQATLKAIDNRLDRYESVLKTIEEIKADIYEHDGIEHRLKYSAEQSEDNSDQVNSLWSENECLRKQVDLLTSVVIRMDRKMVEMEKDITDLRGRSMRDNILIHNFEYEPNEELMTVVPKAIERHLGVKVDFIRIHRNGPVRQTYNGRSITITGKLTNGNLKDKILQAQKSKKSANIQIPFHITPQDPISTVEERKRIFDRADSLRSQNKNVKVARNKIISPNGKTVEDDVPILNNNDILQISKQEREDLESVQTVMTECVEKENSMFFGTGGKTDSIEEVINAYKKACIHPDAACSDHRILVYRVQDSNGFVSEGYHDDGEHGAGRRLLRSMRDNNITNRTFVISRWYGGRHIGFERFQIMLNIVSGLTNQLKGCESF